ncbi:MobA/MobL family protein [Cetobacterium sp. 2A]|uniref:MobA/MobL family protein n=1 Tax=Cetobacterium sp. 2A TaxID=2754723 RepID=UPI00163CC1BB|nr:MobA/MobL family protein [Cetobacterium sp. 2A]MBC2856991.1 MobA/MobL family protein [Cetobacterium sp. 2A]
MAIYNLKVSSAEGRSPLKKFEYIARIDNFSWEKEEKYDDLLYSENCNMPCFAKENPIEFWKNLEIYERANSNQFREIEFSLPCELADEENIELATRFAKKIFEDKFPYSLAVHSKPSSKDEKNNIHCHIMFSERELDGIERAADKFFKRSNPVYPKRGGCKKNREWKSFSKLYEIRETWEKIANDKLKEKEIELISCKSLKNQRIEALLEENFIKAEMLDRNPIGYNRKFVEFSTNPELVGEILEFNDYAIKIKEMKEKEFKLRCENYAEENEKARERFIKSCYEKEGKEYVPSSFDIQEKQEQFNFENVFITSVENKILIDRKEASLRKIQALTEEDYNNRALNILTSNEYSKNIKKLEELNNIYKKLVCKEDFGFKDEKLELEKYFEKLKNDEKFNIKLGATVVKIKQKYIDSKEILLNDLEFLRNNTFKEVYSHYSPKKYEISIQFMNESFEYLKNLREEKELLDKKVKEFKEILNADYRVEIYSNLNPKAAEQYKELQQWKIELEKENNIEKINKLTTAINSREAGFNVFDIKNDINKILEEQTSKLRKEYKILRQKQDDINGKITYSSLMIKELKNMKEYKMIDKVKSLKETYENINKGHSFIEKIKYNVELEQLFKEAKGIDLKEFKLIHAPVESLTPDKKKEYSFELKNQILDFKLEAEKCSKELSKLIITDELIRDRILDKLTNGLYLKEKNNIKHYETEINCNRCTMENKIMMGLSKEKIYEFENAYKITDEQIKIEKQLIREDKIDIQTKLSGAKEQLNVCFKSLLKINKRPKIKRIRRGFPIPNAYKRLKILATGRIDFEDREERKRRRREWENSL